MDRLLVPGASSLIAQVHEVLARPRLSNSIDFERVNRVRSLWQTAMAGAADEGVLHVFESCTRTVETGSVERNELMLALGRPVEKAFCTRAVRQLGRLPTTGSESLDRAVCELLNDARNTDDVDELRSIIEELEELCNVGSPEALNVQRQLICMLLRSPLGRNTGLFAEVRGYLRFVSVIISEGASLEDDTTTEHLMIVNHAARIASPALGADTATLQWCRNLLVSSLEVQAVALRAPRLEPMHEEIRAAITRNKMVLSSLEQRLNVMSWDKNTQPLPAALGRALDLLPNDDSFRQLIERKIRKSHYGSEIERSHAEDFLTYLTDHPTVRALVDPEGSQPRIFDVPEERVRQVDVAREIWRAKIVGQDELRETVMHRLGTLLEASGSGYNLLLLGPPGVGKSMAARIIADAHARDLVVIQGESLTRRGQVAGNEGMYVGAEPGAIAAALLSHRKPPVILIDELGKADLEAQVALATVLDRDRNDSFKDVFFGAAAPFDLSKIIFIITANAGEGIDESILSRTERFNFAPLKTEHKREIVRRAWPAKRDAANLPKSLVLSEKAVEVLANKRTDDPGARQLLQIDLTELANWAHTLKDRNRLPSSIDGLTAKRVVEQTWVDVAPFHDENGFVADIRLGSVGLQKSNKQGEAYFNALSRTWRFILDNDNVNLSIAKGDSVSGYFRLLVRNAQDQEHGASQTDRISLNSEHAYRFTISPPLPTKTKDWLPLLEKGTALCLRLVALTGERWVAPSALLDQGEKIKQRRTGRYDV